MAYYFLGALCALLITVGLLLDLERKRRRLRRIALRLEEITHGKVRSRIRHVRRLTLSSFMYEQLIEQIDAEVSEVEREHGIEPVPMTGRDFFLFEHRLRQLEARVESLALAGDAPA